jgi:hypothetical protein
MVASERVELSHPCEYRNLNPARLPIPPRGQWLQCQRLHTARESPIVIKTRRKDNFARRFVEPTYESLRPESVTPLARSDPQPILCLNAKTGNIVETFGDNGAIALEKDVDRDLTPAKPSSRLSPEAFTGTC